MNLGVNVGLQLKWARLIVDKEMTEKFGKDYFYVSDSKGNSIVTKKAKKMMEENPDRFPRMIDTLFLDDVVYFLCKEELYKICFKKCLDNIYPDGRMEAKTFLSRKYQ